MKVTISKDATNENYLDFVGDNLAITLINTHRIVEEQLTDTLQSDSDVKHGSGGSKSMSRKAHFL